MSLFAELERSGYFELNKKLGIFLQTYRVQLDKFDEDTYRRMIREFEVELLKLLQKISVKIEEQDIEQFQKHVQNQVGDILVALKGIQATELEIANTIESYQKKFPLVPLDKVREELGI